MKPLHQQVSRRIWGKTAGQLWQRTTYDVRIDVGRGTEIRVFGPVFPVRDPVLQQVKEDSR